MMTELTLEEKIACEKEYRANPLTITFEEGQEKRKTIDEEWQQRSTQLTLLESIKNLLECDPNAWKYAVDELREYVALCVDISKKYQPEVDKKFRREHLRIDFATCKSFTYLTQQQ